MTTVAALAVDGVVHMAADSCTNLYDRPITGARKVRRHPAGGGEVLLGFSGDGGLPDLFAARLKINGMPVDAEDPQAWATAVALAMSEVAVEAGMVEDGRMDGTVLLGWGGRLWHCVHGQAIPVPDGVAAIGSGEGPAMGAMDALRAGPLAPGNVVRRAVKIAITRDRYSGGPVLYECLEAS